MPALGDVTLADDGRHDRRVCRRSADAVFFERLHQTRFGVTRWWRSLVVFGEDIDCLQLLPNLELRQLRLALFALVFFAALILALFIGGHEPLECYDRAR